MASVALNIDPLKSLGEGVRAKAGGREWPLPLASTDVSVSEDGGLAVVRTVRVFRNAESAAIEVTMTFPVPGDAILTGLRASIDGRDLVAVAKASKQARATYEDAIDSGKTAILHEEKLRGIHMLSLGNLPPGKEASVTVTYVAPLSFAGTVPTLRIPTTVGEVYGRSPLLPCDDIATGDVSLDATVSVESATAVAQVIGLGSASGTVRLDAAIAIAFPGWTGRSVSGRSGDGRLVTVDVEPVGGGELPLDVTLLFDRSGSTGNLIGGDAKRRTVWDAMRDGVRSALGDTLRDGDLLRVVAFDTTHEELGEFRGPEAVRLVDRIGEPRNGTEIGIPLISTARSHKGDILLVTDGRSHALDIQAVSGLGRRVNVVLVGSDALDAAVGHVAALTGGMTFVVSGDDVASSVKAALASLRIASGAPEARGGDGLPDEATVLRGGARIRMTWTGDGSEVPADDVGRLAAGLVLPSLTETVAVEVAVAHGLCTHLTSLVVVDDAGEAQQGIPATRKVPLMRSAADASGGGVFFFGNHVPKATGSFLRSSAAASPERMSLSASRSIPESSWAAEEMAFTSEFLSHGGIPTGDVSDSPPMPSPRRTRGGLPPEASKKAKPSRGIRPAPAIPPRPAVKDVARPFDLRSTARTVDWDDVAPRVGTEGVSAFRTDVRVVLNLVASLPAIADLAKALGCTAEALAIALLASAAGSDSRSAGRVARRILKGAPSEQPALVAVGLAA